MQPVHWFSAFSVVAGTSLTSGVVFALIKKHEIHWVHAFLVAFAAILIILPIGYELHFESKGFKAEFRQTKRELEEAKEKIDKIDMKTEKIRGSITTLENNMDNFFLALHTENAKIFDLASKANLSSALAGSILSDIAVSAGYNPTTEKEKSKFLALKRTDSHVWEGVLSLLNVEEIPKILEKDSVVLSSETEFEGVKAIREAAMEGNERVPLWLKEYIGLMIEQSGEEQSVEEQSGEEQSGEEQSGEEQFVEEQSVKEQSEGAASSM